MSDFDIWFQQREGELPLVSQWFRTFIASDDANEVEQLFLKHQATLMADEMVEEWKEMIEIMIARTSDPARLLKIARGRDRLRLIEDARRYGVAEAIRKYRQRSH